jgi:hypothetical protein
MTLTILADGKGWQIGKNLFEEEEEEGQGAYYDPNDAWLRYSHFRLMMNQGEPVYDYEDAEDRHHHHLGGA